MPNPRYNLSDPPLKNLLSATYNGDRMLYQSSPSLLSLASNIHKNDSIGGLPIYKYLHIPIHNNRLYINRGSAPCNPSNTHLHANTMINAWGHESRR